MFVELLHLQFDHILCCVLSSFCCVIVHVPSHGWLNGLRIMIESTFGSPTTCWCCSLWEYCIHYPMLQHMIAVVEVSWASSSGKKRSRKGQEVDVNNKLNDVLIPPLKLKEIRENYKRIQWSKMHILCISEKKNKSISCLRRIRIEYIMRENQIDQLLPFH